MREACPVINGEILSVADMTSSTYEIRLKMLSLHPSLGFSNIKLARIFNNASDNPEHQIIAPKPLNP